MPNDSMSTGTAAVAGAAPLSVSRATVFVTHAAPEDNEFALWLSAKLAVAGYRVWVDRRRLRGGDDFWDEIDRVLRNDTVKQIVVFTHRIGKPGVKKELAIGDIMRARLKDPHFMIPIRSDDISFADAPPEFIRGNILNAFPNWHDCLAELLQVLEEAGVPRETSPDAALLGRIVEAREEGRRFILPQPEQALTNWFPITPPERVRYYRFDGLRDHMDAWLRDCRLPHAMGGRLVGSFADPPAFAEASSFSQKAPAAYDIAFADLAAGRASFRDRRGATNDLINLLRQHFDAAAAACGLLPASFANGETGWFFPDGLIAEGRVVLTTPDGRRIRRTMSGKFKTLRWHLCLLARPRLWPVPAYRIHANVVLTEDGRTPLSGDKTHARRRRLTRSWWNHIWRDRLLAGMHVLAQGEDAIPLIAGHERFSCATWPLSVDLPVSYDASDAPSPVEEDEDGTIVLTSALDDRRDPLDDDDMPEAG